MDERSFLFADCQLLILGLYFEHIILGLLFFPPKPGTFSHANTHEATAKV